ncbi:MAG: SusC/RagA family protein, partial [Draconibacterium sp.]
MRKIILLVLGLFFCTAVLAQTTVKGKVVDAKGDSVPGVSVLEQGTSNGVTTDLDGTFTLSVDTKDAVLLFSFVGMKEQKVAVNGRTWLDITMSESVAALDEVVVVGYGVQKKS